MSVIFRPHRKVYPDGTIAILFYQQFIKLLCRFLGVINHAVTVLRGYAVAQLH